MPLEEDQLHAGSDVGHCERIHDGQHMDSGEVDVRRTDLAKRQIPVDSGAIPIRQPSRRLGPEKDREGEEQVQRLVQQNLVEPESGAWSALVVLVRKKEQS